MLPLPRFLCSVCARPAAFLCERRGPHITVISEPGCQPRFPSLPALPAAVTPRAPARALAAVQGPGFLRREGSKAVWALMGGSGSRPGPLGLCRTGAGGEMEGGDIPPLSGIFMVLFCWSLFVCFCQEWEVKLGVLGAVMYVSCHWSIKL